MNNRTTWLLSLAILAPALSSSFFLLRPPTLDFSNVTQRAEAPRTSGAQPISIETDESLIWLQVRVNDAGPATMLLDSAAEYSVFDQSRAAEIGLRATGTAVSSGTGGSVTVGLAKDVTFDVAGYPVAAALVILQPLDFLTRGLGRRVDGILGREIFARYVVEIDYGGLGLRLHDPAGYSYSGKGQEIPLKLLDGKIPTVHGSVVPPGGDPVEADFQVDSGSAQVLTLSRPFVDRHELLASVARLLPSDSTGVGGESPELVGRLAAVRLGALTITSPVVRFSRATQGVFATDRFSGNIGGELLSQFRVIFDYAHERLFLEPGARFGAPFEYNMSGIALEQTSGPAVELLIHAVVPGSPGADAGLQKGDVIGTINGRPAADYRLSAVRQLFRQEGASLAFTIRRDGVTREVTIKTRRLI